MEDPSNSKMFDEDIDEAEEEALLKSDDENDGPKTNVSLSVLRPPSVVELMEDNSLLNGPLPIDQLDNGDDEDMSLDKEIESVDVVDGDTNGAGDKASSDSDDDEDDEDDDDDDEEIKALKEFQAILQELSVNQYAYDKYVRLCELSHTTGDLDNIRKAYTTFSNVYPLTAALWQRYISVELTLAQSEVEIQQVKKLFQRALKDYYSCDLALEYASYAPRCADCATIWEEILGTYGLNCYKGQEFFKLYRQQYPEDSNRDEFVNSFLKELRYPLNNMEESYIEFKVYYEKNKEHFSGREDIDWEEIDAKYFKAKEHLKKILPFEEKLQSLGTNLYRERAEVYFEYIKESDKFLDENVLQTIYERMVADCCLNADCWLKYIDFIDYRDEFGRPKDLQKLPLFEQTPDDICLRALRNCTWSPELYIKRIQVLEKLERSKTEVQEVLESAAVAGFQTPEPAVAVWLEYLTYLRRHTDWTDPDECDIMRKNFNLAWTILGQQWGVLADCNCEILQFWGRLEYGPLQDPKKGKELWTTVMESADNALKSGLWIEFALLEMRRDLDATRRLFSKALNTPGIDNPLVITSAWERFERCNGNVKTLNNCLKECNKFKQEYSVQLANFSQQKSQKSTAKATTKRKSNTQPENTVPPSKQAKVAEEQQQQPSKPQVPAVKKEATFKEHENQEIDLSKDHLRIFLSNLDYNLTEDEIREELSELNIIDIELIRSGNGRSRGFGYAVLPTEADVEKALSLDRKDVRGRPVFISSVLRDKEQRQKFKYSAEMEPQKLFVKSLPNDANQSEVENLFKPFGNLKDVRLVYHKSGKFKQIAYVEFEQEASAGKAVMALDGTDIRGHKISVAISAPPPKPTAGATTNPLKMLGLVSKRNKVFDQKPRMSLIPMSVRKNLTNKSAAPTTALKPSDATSAPTQAPKSNADFRRFLTK